MTKKKGFRRETICPTLESPTWGDLRQMAVSVMSQLGGNAGAAQKLNERSFYALATLSSLNAASPKMKRYIFSQRHVGLA